MKMLLTHALPSETMLILNCSFILKQSAYDLVEEKKLSEQTQSIHYKFYVNNVNLYHQLPDLGKAQIEGVTGLLNQVIHIVTEDKANAIGQVLSLSPTSSPTTIRKFRINVESKHDIANMCISFL